MTAIYDLETYRHNRVADEFTSIVVGGRSLTPAEWRSYIDLEVRYRVGKLTDQELLDLLSTYHSKTVKKHLGRSPKVVEASRIVSPELRIRLAGNGVGPSYKPSEQVEQAFRVSYDRAHPAVQKIGAATPTLLKALLIFIPVMALICLSCAIWAGVVKL